ncbi:hypothetical protein G647_00258 [Cladophialophora carrionii CBS 160.54]|uniref:Clr5 domain-containing protein n=1 Tax=Cladophialophora carrionii CBS 160.54 TaxID=1279043 RepID=V9DLM0_9EURO|nr:uncharacterized protein G647_00258 [Cladophialophora carrionii CBS 160.54]ETI27809.1 hypothetical protein G647_00258 [Cladophialophora carrionii CBS 160.54]
MSRLSSHTHTSIRAGRVAVKTVTRKKGPSADEWALVEPLLEVWYIQEERSQKEILELLAGRHGLVVKPNVLKTRLSKLKLRKNDTKEEREAAVAHLKQCVDLGVTAPLDIKINGKHPHWDRVYRHGRKESGIESSWLQKGSEWHVQVSRLCLKATPVDHHSEMALLEVKSYWSTVLTQPVRAVSPKSKQDNNKTLPDPSTLRIGFLTGLRLLNKGQEESGQREFRRTRGEASKVFEMQEPDLTKEILSLFSARAWTLHPAEFLSVAEFLRGLSIEYLGLQHPVSRMLDAFVALVAAGTLEAFEVIPEQALKVMVDLADTEKSRVKLESSYLHSVEVDLINKVRSRLGPVAVRKLIQKKFSHYRSTLGDRSRHTLSMRMDLALTHLDEAKGIDGQEKPDEKRIAERKGEEILSKIVAQGEKYPADRYRIGSYLVAAQELARYYFAQQEFPNAHKYYVRAVIWATEKLGKHHSYTSLLLTELRALRKLVRLGMVDVPAAEEELWQTHIGKTIPGEVNEAVDWEPYHADIDLDDNLELAEHENTPQNEIDATPKLLDQSQRQMYEGSSSQVQDDVQLEGLDYRDYQDFEPDYMQPAGSSFPGDLDVLDHDLSGDAYFASQMTFESLLKASEQDMLEFLPADPSHDLSWLEDIDGRLEA